MRQKRKVVYDSVYKCDRCGKEFNYMIGSLKLNKALLNYNYVYDGTTNNSRVWKMLF